MGLAGRVPGSGFRVRLPSPAPSVNPTTTTTAVLRSAPGPEDLYQLSLLITRLLQGIDQRNCPGLGLHSYLFSVVNISTSDLFSEAASWPKRSWRFPQIDPPAATLTASRSLLTIARSRSVNHSPFNLDPIATHRVIRPLLLTSGASISCRRGPL